MSRNTVPVKGNILQRFLKDKMEKPQNKMEGNKDKTKEQKDKITRYINQRTKNKYIPVKISEDSLQKYLKDQTQM